ncbi:MAG: isoprenylcysteine carboxylmethyltransferase family protein, partial [Bacteroidota bacterium]|nr:isoprenylcysteine carboxylmethyltransferase family protein [Bacteroidota bacterium]
LLGGVALNGYFSHLGEGIRSLFIASEPGKLQTGGLHRRVRHPLYSATLLLIWGFWLLVPEVNILETVGLLTLYIVVGIRFEERKLVRIYGEDYRDYRRKVPGLIPRLFRRK